MRIKLYYPESHFEHTTNRRYLFPLLKAFKKGVGFTDMQRKEVYKVTEMDYEFVKDIQFADIVLLPLVWNYYVISNKKSLAERLIIQAKALNKHVVMVNAGDYGFSIGEFENILMLQNGGSRSLLPIAHQGMPVFIEDPLKRWYNTTDIFVRPYTTIPTVGFCGQVAASWMTAVKEIFKTTAKKVLYHLRINKHLPQKIQSTSYRRYRYMSYLKHSSFVQTNFIFRKKHGGGVDFGREKTTLVKEFYDNMLDSDYVFCYRGAGNFSVRFYEALAMGRIPVFVNSDCILPLYDLIKWRQHVVWVEEHEVINIAKKIKEFHDLLTPDSYMALQHSNRRLWEEHMSYGGFFKAVFNTTLKK